MTLYKLLNISKLAIGGGKLRTSPCSRACAFLFFLSPFLVPVLSSCEHVDPAEFYDTTTRADSTAADTSLHFTLSIDTTLEVYKHLEF